MATLAFKDELLDAQLKRAVGHAPYGGADVGECLATAGRIGGADLDAWHAEWTATARRCEALAERSDAETARLALLRASNYHRTAGVMLMGAPVDPRLSASYAAQAEAFRRALAPEELAIPFEGTTLPGYFFPAGPEAGPTVVLVGGYDGTAEELYFASGAAALARGYHVVAFDGPGQGAVLVEQGLPVRPDWETVVAAVLDHVLERPEVDAGRVALIGWSLGAHLVLRAASAEPRVAACVADCGSFDLHASFLERVPGLLTSARARPALGAVLRRVAAKPTAGWALRRGMLVHGAPDPLALLEAMRPFSLAGHAERISCPTLVCMAEEDDISASSPRIADALTCSHELLRFTSAEGAGDHCEALARTLFHARAFAWLDPLLKP